MSLVRTSGALALLLILTLSFGASYSHAQTADEEAARRIAEADTISRAAADQAARAAAALQAQIDATNAEIKRIRDEIAQLQGQLTDTSAKRATLQNTIKQLDLQIQTLQKQLSLTTKEITNKDREISKLAGTIGETNQKIAETEAGVADSLRQLQQMDNISPATAIFGGDTLSDFFDEAIALSALRSDLQNRIEDLSTLRSQLQANKSSVETKRSELSKLKKSLDQQKLGVAAARTDQSTLLTQTKNKESEYQKLIEQKKLRRRSSSPSCVNSKPT
jgi:peptidoglycan hydrolase CwlO-like protein